VVLKSKSPTLWSQGNTRAAVQNVLQLTEKTLSRQLTEKTLSRELKTAFNEDVFFFDDDAGYLY